MKIVQPEKGEFSLSNNGELSIVFIGIGSAFARKNFQTNLLIIKGENHLQVDSGTKCSLALTQMGLSVPSIKNIHITHSHADHIGGLEEIALMGRYVARSRPKMYITKEYQKFLWNESLRGGCGYGEKHDDKYLSFEDFFDAIYPKKLKNYPRDTYEFNVGKINIKSMRTKHILEAAESWENAGWSTGIIIDDRVMFSGDTQFDRDLIIDYDKKFNLEVIFHDVQFFTGGVHSSLDELKDLPADIKSKMYLVHVSDNWMQFDDKIEEYGFAGFVQPQVYYNFNKPKT